MLLRNYDNVMSAIGLVGFDSQLQVGSEFGSSNLNIKVTNGTIKKIPNFVPFEAALTYDNNQLSASTWGYHLFCSSNNDEPNYDDYTMTNLCNAKFVTHYYTPVEEITLDSGAKAWKRTYKKLYNANIDLTIGSIGVTGY